MAKVTISAMIYPYIRACCYESAISVCCYCLKVQSEKTGSGNESNKTNKWWLFIPTQNLNLLKYSYHLKSAMSFKKSKKFKSPTI